MRKDRDVLVRFIVKHNTDTCECNALLRLVILFLGMLSFVEEMGTCINMYLQYS